jgi:O-antigen ligase
VPLTGDNLYLTYGVQLGVVGLLAFVAMLGSIFLTSWRVVWETNSEHRVSSVSNANLDPRRRFFAVVALATLGIFLNGITSMVFSSNVLAYVFFLCAGAAVTAAQFSPRR